MEEIHTSIIIDAPAFEVWHTLTDFANYPTWNPFIRSIKGDLKVSKKLEMEIMLANDKPVIMDPIITEIDLERKIIWSGRIGNGSGSLFNMEHKLVIEPLAHNRTILFQVERLTGELVPFVADALHKQLHKGFEDMNLAVKMAAERRWKADLDSKPE